MRTIFFFFCRDYFFDRLLTPFAQWHIYYTVIYYPLNWWNSVPHITEIRKPAIVFFFFSEPCSFLFSHTEYASFGQNLDCVLIHGDKIALYTLVNWHFSAVIGLWKQCLHSINFGSVLLLVFWGDNGIRFRYYLLLPIPPRSHFIQFSWFFLFPVEISVLFPPLLPGGFARFTKHNSDLDKWG